MLWVALAVHVPIAVVAGVRSRVVRPGSDFENYYDIGTKPAGRTSISRSSFQRGDGKVFRTLAPIAGNRHRFGVALVIGSVVADLVIVARWPGGGRRGGSLLCFVAIPLLDLFLLRMDLWSTALATVAVAAWRRGWPSLAAIGYCGGGRVQAVAAGLPPAARRAARPAGGSRAACDGGRRRRATILALAVGGRTDGCSIKC